MQFRYNMSFSIVAKLNPFYTKRFESLYLKKEFLVCCFVNNCGERECHKNSDVCQKCHLAKGQDHSNDVDCLRP